MNKTLHSLPWWPLASAHGRTWKYDHGTYPRPFRCRQEDAGWEATTRNRSCSYTWILTSFEPWGRAPGYLPEREHLGSPQPGWLPHTFPSCLNIGQNSQYCENHTDPTSEEGYSEMGVGSEWVTPQSWTQVLQLFLLLGKMIFFSEATVITQEWPKPPIPVGGIGWLA